ncbi:hypothetical protein HDV00_006658 [Rhizophlyctis rosea]|nr:hypothetical protein HDV00_006658 [Rhizophlyctis rosea]
MAALVPLLEPAGLTQYAAAIEELGWTPDNLEDAEKVDLVPAVLTVQKFRALQKSFKDEPYPNAPSNKLDADNAWVKLWKAITDREFKEDHGRLLIPPDTFPGFTIHGVFIRKCYRDILELVRDEGQERGARRNFIILGTPGVGKSAFIPVLLGTFGTKTSVYLERENAMGLFFNNKSGSVHFGNLAVERLPPDTLYLVDSKLPQATKSSQMTILVSSPRRERWYTFSKSQPAPTLLIMPRWSWRELKLWNERIEVKSEDQLTERYELFGGIARHVLGDLVNNDADSMVRQALSRSSLDKIYTVLGSMTWTDDVSDDLVHAVTDGKDYKAFCLKFPSKQMANIAYQKYHEQHVQRLYWFLNVTDPKAAGLRGQFFEPLAHQELIRNVKYTLAPLVGRGLKDDDAGAVEDDDYLVDANDELPDELPDGPEDQDVEMDDVASAIVGQPSPIAYEFPEGGIDHVFTKLEDVQTAWEWISTRYCRPKSRIFCGLDSFVGLTIEDHNTIVMFQMTVSLKHPIMLKGIRSIMQHFGNQYDYVLCFVVPENIVGGFQYQPYLTNEKKVAKRIPAEIAEIPQYVLGLRTEVASPTSSASSSQERLAGSRRGSVASWFSASG